MKLKKTLMILGATLLLASCGGTPGSSSAGGGIVTPSDDPIFSINGLENDIYIEDGELFFDEEQEINMWTVVSQPDIYHLENLVKEFNSLYAGEIHITLKSIGHYDFYKTLDDTWVNDPEGIPDLIMMHNEKTVEYARKGYLYALDELIGEKTTIDFDFAQLYPNIDRVTKYQDHRFAIPVDAHGFLTSFRQDIIKKNNLGFDNNTRFIPQSRAEYQELLEKARAKADSAEGLLVRNINKIDFANNPENRKFTWEKVDSSLFAPSFLQSTDPDGLAALYCNGGQLVNESQTEIIFQNNKGFQSYITDQVDRYNNRLMWEGNKETGANTEMFGSGYTLMFAEGPWWVGQTYTAQYNSPELAVTEVKRDGKIYQTGVTAEEAADPVYAKPYVAAHSYGWWTLDEYNTADNELANKWYGNGHAISISRNVKSLQKAAACLKFTKWYTQGESEKDPNSYNLTNWCTSGHMPAWKNVYESETYQTTKNNSVVLTALGDPADIVAMEGLVYETMIFNGFAAIISEVQAQLTSQNGCDKSKALQIIEDMAFSVQGQIDMLL